MIISWLSDKWMIDMGKPIFLTLLNDVVEIIQLHKNVKEADVV